MLQLLLGVLHMFKFNFVYLAFTAAIIGTHVQTAFAINDDFENCVNHYKNAIDQLNNEVATHEVAGNRTIRDSLANEKKPEYIKILQLLGEARVIGQRVIGKRVIGQERDVIDLSSNPQDQRVIGQRVIGQEVAPTLMNLTNEIQLRYNKSVKNQRKNAGRGQKSPAPVFKADPVELAQIITDLDDNQAFCETKRTCKSDGCVIEQILFNYEDAQSTIMKHYLRKKGINLSENYYD